MYTINISFKIEHPIADEWVAWIMKIFIPGIKESGFSNCSLSSVIGHDDEFGATYVVQFNIRTEEKLTEYHDKLQHKFHQQLIHKWGERALFFETTLKKFSW